MASLRKRLKKTVKKVGKAVGKVVRYAAPVVGAAVGGPLGGLAGTAVGTGAGLIGSRRKTRKKAIIEGVAFGGAVTAASGALNLVQGLPLGTSGIDSVSNLFGGGGAQGLPQDPTVGGPPPLTQEGQANAFQRIATDVLTANLMNRSAQNLVSPTLDGSARQESRRSLFGNSEGEASGSDSPFRNPLLLGGLAVGALFLLGRGARR